MLKKSNRQKLLNLFFTDPSPQYQLREICRKIRLSPKSVKNYLEELSKEGLIRITKHRVHEYPLYQANRDDPLFRLLKRNELILEIKETGLLDLLNDRYMPDVIILFGSASRGEDTNESDIDLFLQCKGDKTEFRSAEHQLNRKINLFFSEDFNKLSSELKNNIINGIKLRGYLKIWG
ncbi:nucleotidyltransferase domain-containing protein [Candidatus Woesearchaeota archaeon]|nr:nucleotidyltransferase domain-containing protein [Candidatus Woesearchaeota archaeon]